MFCGEGHQIYILFCREEREVEVNLFIKEGLLWLLRAVMGICIFGFLQRAAYPLPKRGHVRREERISIRAFLVKYAGGTVKCDDGMVKYAGGIGFVCCGLRFGTGASGLLSLPGLLAFCYLCILLLVSLSDLETRRIDDRFQAGIVLIGLLSLWLDMGHTLPERCIGVFAVSLPMLLFSVAASGAFGGGDIKLMASSGFLLGWRGIVAAMFLGLLAGGCYALIQMLRKKVGSKDRIAFGPFLALGLAAALFWGDQIAERYLLSL